MKYQAIIALFLLIICEAVPPNPKADEMLVGVSNDRLENLVRRALEGFKYVMLYGDEELELEPMEPYLIEEESMWDYEDETEKHNIYVTAVGASHIFGLSNYTVKNVNASMRDLHVKIVLSFDFLDFRGKYKIGGSLFDKLVPLFGGGSASLRAEKMEATITLNFSLADSYIVVEDSDTSLSISSFRAIVQNVMGIPEPYTMKIVNVILHGLYKRYKSEIDESINDELLDMAEYTFSGMTLKELLNFLKYLAKKANTTSTRSQITKPSSHLRENIRKLASQNSSSLL